MFAQCYVQTKEPMRYTNKITDPKQVKRKMKHTIDKQKEKTKDKKQNELDDEELKKKKKRKKNKKETSQGFRPRRA